MHANAGNRRDAINFLSHSLKELPDVQWRRQKSRIGEAAMHAWRFKKTDDKLGVECALGPVVCDLAHAFIQLRIATACLTQPASISTFHRPGQGRHLDVLEQLGRIHRSV